MSRTKAILTAVLLSGAALQLYPGVERNNPETPSSREIVSPAAVHRVLRRSCYDCHSNETRWPWYGYVAPTSWLVAYDVKKGRQQLNFSTWPETPPPGAECFFKRRIVEQVESGEMPPVRYWLLHPTVTLTVEERRQLQRWARSGCGEE